jgi:hypothetical protein
VFDFLVYPLAGDIDQAISAIIESSHLDVTSLTGLWEPGDTALRNDPRIKTLMRDYGLPELWRQRGFPPLCRPLGEDDFECD